MLEHLGHGGQPRQELAIEGLLATRDLRDRHGQTVALVERGDDLGDGYPAPRVKEVLGELAAPLAERLLPRGVVERHRVGDGSVAVEEVRAEGPGGEGQLHGGGILARVGKDVGAPPRRIDAVNARFTGQAPDRLACDI